MKSFTKQKSTLKPPKNQPQTRALKFVNWSVIRAATWLVWTCFSCFSYFSYFSWTPIASAIELGEGVTTEDYNATGVGINSTLHHLADALKDESEMQIALELSDDFKTFNFGTHHPWNEPIPGVRIGDWRPNTTPNTTPSTTPNRQGKAATTAALLTWRQQMTSIDRWIIKLADLKRVNADKSSEARIRFEVIGDLPNGERITQRGHFKARFTNHNGHQEITSLQLIDAFESTGNASAFSDQAKNMGLDFFGTPDSRFLPPSNILKFQTSRHSVGGVSISDINGDGFDDILFAGGESPKLFLNQNGKHFTDHTKAAGLDKLKHVNVTLFADFDNDGDQDLYLGFFFEPNRLMRNDGNGHFTDVTPKSGLSADNQVASLTALDANNDGNLDLYVGRFLNSAEHIPQMIHYSRNGEPNRLYLGKGDLTFKDVSAPSNTDDHGLTLGATAADYDHDGDQDLYLSNDFGRNVLLRNNGDGTFTDVAKTTGALAISGGMGTNFGDYDNDGNMDIYVSSIHSNQRWFSHNLNIRGYIMKLAQSPRREALQAAFLDLKEHLGDSWDIVGQHGLAGNYLLQNNGDGTFTDVSDTSHAREYGWYWGSGFLDIDNDGFLDIYAANGWISGPENHDLCLDFARDAVQSPTRAVESRIYSDDFIGRNSWNGRERNHMLLNNRNGDFREVGSALGLDEIKDARGMAVADFDHDGDPDIVINNYKAQASLYINDLNAPHHWVAFRLQGTRSNRDAIGAEVTVTLGDRQVTRLVGAGHAYASQFSLEQLVGLGAATKIDKLQVRWPNGAIETFTPPPINQRVHLVEGQGQGLPDTNASATIKDDPTEKGGAEDARPNFLLWAILGGLLAALIKLLLSRRKKA